MNVQTDRVFAPAGSTVVRYLVVAVTAPFKTKKAERPAAHIALVLDRSGSMGGRKLDLAKQAVDHAIRLLNGGDRLAVVCYDNEVDTLLGCTPASVEAKALATSRLRSIEARGNTDLCGGWLRGAQELEIGAPETDAEVVRRVLLLSDGLANHGVTQPDELHTHAAALRAKGITTSTFGLGADFDEQVMAGIATHGGGHFYFIEQPAQISDFFMSEIGEALEVVARDARLVITAGAGTEITCLNQIPVEKTGGPGGDVSIRLGDLVSEQQVTLVLGIGLTTGAVGTPVGITARLTDRDHALFSHPMTIEWMATDSATDAAQPVGIEVLVQVATLMAERARTEALNANRRGDFVLASKILAAGAGSIRALAPNLPQVLAIANDLESERALFQDAMSPQDRKARHFASMNVMYSRSPEGRARKRDPAS